MNAIRLVCPRCAKRYALVVDPACPICDGAGLLAVPHGEDPWARARAVTLVPDGVTIAALREAGLLGTGESEGLPNAPRGMEARTAVGRRAGALLVAKGLRAPTERQPARPRRSKAERDEEYRRGREDVERIRMDMRRRAMEREAAQKAAEAMAERHAEEWQEIYESELVVAALGRRVPV